jgi:hypothetical protein
MQAFRCDVVAIFMAIFACAIAVASSASAYGVQDAGRFAPSPTQSTVESEEVLEGLRAGHRSGVHVRLARRGSSILCQ